MVESTDDTPQPSLYSDLAEGRAGIGVRILVALALAVFLVGAGLVLSYWMAAIVPYWSRNYYYQRAGYTTYPGVYPRDELIAMVMLVAGTVWLAAVMWLFFKHSRRRGLLKPTIYTVSIIAATVFLGILAEDSLRGDSEYVIAGLALIAGAWLVLIWVQAVRRITSRRPLLNSQDKRADVRCPTCGYRMVGLYESRCPECGTGYTLDELIARQNFAKEEVRATGAGIVPPPPAPVSDGGRSGSSLSAPSPA